MVTGTNNMGLVVHRRWPIGLVGGNVGMSFQCDFFAVNAHLCTIFGPHSDPRPSIARYTRFVSDSRHRLDCPRRFIAAAGRASWVLVRHTARAPLCVCVRVCVGWSVRERGRSQFVAKQHVAGNYARAARAHTSYSDTGVSYKQTSIPKCILSLCSRPMNNWLPWPLWNVCPRHPYGTHIHLAALLKQRRSQWGTDASCARRKAMQPKTRRPRLPQWRH
jgi:hypothetical protein